MVVGERLVEIMENQMTGQEQNNWYFTFGCGTKHADRYVKITTSDYGRARQLMFERYGKKWAFQYSEEEYDEAIAKWNYRLLEHIIDVQ